MAPAPKLGPEAKDAQGRYVVRMAVVGGYGKGAFIGKHHDTGMHYATQLNIFNEENEHPIVFETVAAALNIDAKLAQEGGRKMGIKRVYDSYQQLIEKEAKLPEDQRAHAVSIRVPYAYQHQVIRDFIEAGYHIAGDKPNAIRPSDALWQKKQVDKDGLVMAITYTYSGSPMVMEMRQRVKDTGYKNFSGFRGLYPQGWIIELGKNENFRLQEEHTGGWGVLADLGASHTLTDLEFISGLEIEKIQAKIRTIPNHSVPAECTEVDNYGATLLELGDGTGFTIPATASWAQVASTFGNDHQLNADGIIRSLEWKNTCIPGAGPEVLGIFENGRYTFIPRDPFFRDKDKNSLFTSKEALRAMKGPVAHGEALDMWFGAIYRNFGDLVGEAVYGIKAPEEAKIVRNADNGLRTAWFLYKVAESHIDGQVEVDAKFDEEAIPALEDKVQSGYLDLIKT